MGKTNIEKLKELPTSEFWNAIKNLAANHFKEYIDYEAWLDSENENINDFISNEGTVVVKPSKAEITCFKNSYKLEHGKKPSEKEIEDYIASMTEEVLLLEKTSVYNKPYYTVGKPEHNRIMKVPCDCIAGKITEQD